MDDAVKDKVLRMWDAGFSTREIVEACCQQWPAHPVGATEVRRIVRDRVEVGA